MLRERQAFFLDLGRWLRTDAKLAALVQQHLSASGAASCWGAIEKSGALKSDVRAGSPLPRYEPEEKVRSFAEEEYYRDRLVADWNGGATNLEDINLAVRGISHRIHRDPSVAPFYLDLLEQIAGSGMAVPEVHLVLSDVFRRGHGVEANPRLALDYLEHAIAHGSNNARWWHANLLVNNEGLEDVLERNVDAAIEIYRDLAWDSADISIYCLARGSLVPLLISGKHAGQLSPKDEELVSQYADNDTHIVSAHYPELARFYSEGVGSRDYHGPEYRRARDLLTRGAQRSRVPGVQQKCRAVLAEWGLPTG